MSLLAKLKARDLSSLSSQPGYEERVPGNTGSKDLSSFLSFNSYQERSERGVHTALGRATHLDAERSAYEKNELNEISPDPADWAGEVEAQPSPAPGCEESELSEISPGPGRMPPKASLMQRLVAAGCTITPRGGPSVEAPAGISAELLHEVEARGWRVIPGGRPSAEAEHDSWLTGVPVAELES